MTWNKEYAQELFDQVVTHLSQQKKPATVQDRSKSETEVCCYLGPDGKKCAVGCLFTDEEYQSEFEGRSVFHLKIGKLLPPRLSPYWEMLYHLQTSHDRAKDKDTLKNRLHELATGLKLNTNLLTLITEWNPNHHA